jgi:nucleotide-binding universal stress UspA family protein
MAFTHVLVPTDFSPIATHALQYAFDEATVHGARITLLHVMQPHTHTEVYYVTGTPGVRVGYDPALGGPLPGLQPRPPTTVRHDYNEEALTRLQDLVPPQFARPCEVEVAQGEPAETIVRFAGERAVDLIVMGTHGRTSLQHVLLGSVAEKVVRLAPCPVLTVKSPKA